jgi:hypothetical protein
MLDRWAVPTLPGRVRAELSVNHVLEPGVKYLPDFYTCKVD